jgi:hypothetical protein
MPSTPMSSSDRQTSLSVVSHPPPVPPTKVDHHCTAVLVVYLHLTEYASNAHTSYYVFMLFNLTSIWNLPTLSTGECGHDGVPSLISPRA